MTARAKSSRGYLEGWIVSKEDTLLRAKRLQKHGDFLLARLIDTRSRFRKSMKRVEMIDGIIARLKRNIRGGAK
jgi:hypothetical protein